MNPKFLYHGTSQKSAKDIIQNGIDINKSDKGYFGKGFYTATDESLAKSNYADFAEDEGPGIVLKFSLKPNANILDLDNPDDFDKWKKGEFENYAHRDDFDQIMIDAGFDGLRDEGSFGGIVIYNPKVIKLMNKNNIKISSKEIILYHGTTKDKAQQIKREGLKSSRSYDAQWYMLSTNFNDAASFAYKEPVVVKIKIPLKENNYWEGYPYLWPVNNDKSTYKGDFYSIKETIPSKFIKQIIPIKTANKIARILYISSIITKEEFYKNNNIDEDEMSWLGSGYFGNAYAIGNNKVLKITNSKKEYEIAKKLINSHLDGFVNYYVAEKIGNEYLIIMEQLETDGDIEDKFYELQSILDNQELPIQYIHQYLDMDELNLNTDMIKFINDISDIARSYHSLGIQAGDINPDNLGYDKHKKVKAFDIFDKQ